MELIKTYVGEDGKLHFIDSTGADSVLPFNGKRMLTVNLRCTAAVNGSYGNGTWVFTINTDGTVTTSCPNFGNGNANIYGLTVSYIGASLS